MTTPNFSITELAASQAQKYVTVNEALRVVDTAMNLTVIRADNTAPPGSPSEGDKYIPFAPATGLWVGKEDSIAAYINAEWIFFTPAEGWRAYDQTTNTLRLWNGTAWIDFGSSLTASAGTSGDILLWGVNTIPDTTNRLAVKSDAVLFSHDDVTPGTGDMRVTLNKSAVGKDASFIFQDAFSSKAQFGLLGTDNFTLKVGGSYTTALVAYQATGAVEFTQHPKFSAYLNFGQTITAGAWAQIPFNNTRHNDQGAFGSSIFTAPHDGYYVFGAGYVFEDPGSSIPLEMRIGLSVNGATPTEDRAFTLADSYNQLATTTSSLNITGMLKLTAGDTVEVQVFFVTNNGRILADENHFWGAQIA